MPEIILPQRILGVVQDERNYEYCEQITLAFATSDREQVDQHFGTAIHFCIYQKTEHGWTFIRVVEFPQAPKGSNHDKLQSRIDNLSIADAVYCLAVGSSAIQRMAQLKIQPVVLEKPESIKSLLKEFTFQTTQKPESWQARLLRKKQRNLARSDDLSDLLNEPWTT